MVRILPSIPQSPSYLPLQTRRMARNKKNSETIRRRKFSGMGLYKRRSVGMKKYLMIRTFIPPIYRIIDLSLEEIQGRRSPQLSIKAAPVSSWICTNTSWTNMKTVDMTTFEFSMYRIPVYSSRRYPFKALNLRPRPSSKTLAMTNSLESVRYRNQDTVLFESSSGMLVYNVWIWVMEQSDCDLETTYSDDEDYATVYSNCNTSCTECDMAELFEWMDQWTNDEILQESKYCMILYLP